MTDARARVRLAMAEEQKEDVLAPRLGRALKFALFDAAGNDVRGPFNRVRHDAPGDVCDDHADLMDVLHDCNVLIAGSVGPHMARFWTKVFGLIFGLGAATGIVLEFGTNRATYSRFAGGIFGSMLAAEGIFAFFLESGFLVILLFGWNNLGLKSHFFQHPFHHRMVAL